MPKCQFLFSAVFVFQKSCTRNILGKLWKIHRNSIIQEYSGSQKGSNREPIGWPDMGQARPSLGPRLPCVWAHQGSVDSASSPIYSPSRENPRDPSRNPRKVLTPPSTRNPSREGSEALPGTLPEGEIIAGGLYITMPASATMRE